MGKISTIETNWQNEFWAKNSSRRLLLKIQIFYGKKKNKKKKKKKERKRNIHANSMTLIIETAPPKAFP